MIRIGDMVSIYDKMHIGIIIDDTYKSNGVYLYKTMQDESIILTLYTNLYEYDVIRLT